MAYKEFLDGMVAQRHIRLGRIGHSEDFANLACFLTSDVVSYIIGTGINTDSSPVARSALGSMDLVDRPSVAERGHLDGIGAGNAHGM